MAIEEEGEEGLMEAQDAGVRSEIPDMVKT